MLINNVVFMKGGKHDGNIGHCSGHVINGTSRLYVCLSLLFSSMVMLLKG